MAVAHEVADQLGVGLGRALGVLAGVADTGGAGDAGVATHVVDDPDEPGAGVEDVEGDADQG